ncbi:10642_t:CDS:1 [Ambispora gerdemannii]|uniref:10642_t:CDS:1 n=1 Tax=Ambispora gerdemannii TaxID=144530 RepID=A0A9N9DCI6_9GLOM|nr:10642_t:CDS:1 [Ambispora gerdemannii]
MPSTQSSIQNSTMKQPLFPSKPMNIVAQQNSNVSTMMNSNYKYEQQQQELFRQQTNAAAINASQQRRQHVQQLTHHRSMPLLNSDVTVIPESKPLSYSSIFQRTPPLSSRQNISGSYGSKPFSFLSQGATNNLTNLKKASNSTTQYRQPSLYSASTTFQTQSPEPFNRTPPLLQQHSGSLKLNQNSGNSSWFVSSNPPTPVDLPMVPSTSQYHSLIGSNGNSSNSNIGTNYNNNSGVTSGLQLPSTKYAQSHYGSVQAQQGMNVVNMTNGIGGFAIPLLGSQNHNNVNTNNSNNLQISAKKVEGIAANSGGSAPVLIAPPGLGVAGGFGAPTISLQSSSYRARSSTGAGMGYNNTGARIGNAAGTTKVAGNAVINTANVNSTAEGSYFSRVVDGVGMA